MTELTWAEALATLKEGNSRFAQGASTGCRLTRAKRLELVEGQSPFAAVLGCSDSRVPPEILFDQGAGDLFVVRLAGNIATQEAVGSMEYAVEHLGVPLIVVLGHERCGAVAAAASGTPPEGVISSITDMLAPSLEIARAGGAEGSELLEACANENMAAATETLLQSIILREAVEAERLVVVAAKYHLVSGVVEWVSHGRAD